MSATSAQSITIRNDAELTVYRGAALSGATYYHGTYILQGPDGYWRNATSSVVGAKGAGILASMNFTDQAMSAVTTVGTMTATANGDLVANTNCFDVYTGGEFEATFESTNGIAKASEGDIVYIYDNNTLTVNPSVGIYPIGRLSKYKTSTTGSVTLFGLAADIAPRVIMGGIVGQVSDTSSFVVKSIANPYGADVVIRNFNLGIKTTGSTAHTAYAGIAPTSSNAVATFIMSSSSINFGVKGIWSPANDPITHTTIFTTADGAGDRLWKSTEYFSIVGSSSGATTLVGWYRLEIERL